MGQPAGADGVGQRADHGVLTDKAGKGGRPVFAGQNLIGGAGGGVSGGFGCGAGRGGRAIGRGGLGHRGSGAALPAAGGGGWEAGYRPRPKLVTAASFRI